MSIVRPISDAAAQFTIHCRDAQFTILAEIEGVRRAAVRVRGEYSVRGQRTNLTCIIASTNMEIIITSNHLPIKNIFPFYTR